MGETKAWQLFGYALLQNSRIMSQNKKSKNKKNQTKLVVKDTKNAVDTVFSEMNPKEVQVKNTISTSAVDTNNYKDGKILAS